MHSNPRWCQNSKDNVVIGVSQDTHHYATTTLQQGCKRDVARRDRDETEALMPRDETRPKRLRNTSRDVRDRDVDRDVQIERKPLLTSVTLVYHLVC